MVDLKELKTVVDEVLSDMTVSSELKRKTLKGFARGRRPWVKTAFVPAICAGVVFIAITILGLPYLNKQPVSKISGSAGDAGISTMADSGDKHQDTAPDSTFSPDTQVLESWKVNSMEDAKKYMDGAVLIPSYIPDGFKLKEIIAAGPTVGDAISVAMEFESQGRSFAIYQNKGVTKRLDLKDSKKVDINGLTGYINSAEFDNGNGIIYNTDLKWYKDDCLYMVQGSLPEDEAVKVACSLK